MSQARLVAGLVGLCLATGCWYGPIDDSLLQVPEGVAAVEASKEQFEQPAEHPLLSVPAGTVIDDLAGLEGCWGAYAGPEAVSPLLADVEFYRFDFGQGEIVHQILQRGPRSYLSILAGSGVNEVVEALYHSADVASEYTYESVEIADPDRVVAALTHSSGSTNRAGMPPDEHTLEEPTVWELQVTLDGENFKFGDSLDASSGFEGPHRANLIFHRFDCPE